jgi:WD40 repeat protein
MYAKSWCFFILSLLWGQAGKAQPLILTQGRILPKTTSNVQEICASPQGNFWGVMVLNKIVILYNQDGQLVRQHTAPLQATWAKIAFSPDETLIALAQVRQDSTFLQLHKTDTGEMLQQILLFATPISALVWHEQAQVLMCVSEKREFYAWLWEDNSLKLAHKRELDKNEIDEVWTLTATSNGRLWALGGIGKEIEIYEWKKEDLRLRQSLKIKEPVYALAFHPIEPKLFISTAKNLKGYQYQRKDWQQTDSLPIFSPIAHQVLMLRGKKGLVCVQENLLIQYILQENVFEPHIIYRAQARILAHALSQNEKWWLIATADGKLQLFEVGN